MNHSEEPFDYQAFGQEVRRRREEKGLTQNDLAQLVDRSDRTILNIENHSQRPSVDLLSQLARILEFSVDKFIFPCTQNPESELRQRLSQKVNSMNEKELIVMDSTADGLRKARDAGQ